MGTYFVDIFVIFYRHVCVDFCFFISGIWLGLFWCCFFSPSLPPPSLLFLPSFSFYLPFFLLETGSHSRSQSAFALTKQLMLDSNKWSCCLSFPSSGNTYIRHKTCFCFRSWSSAHPSHKSIHLSSHFHMFLLFRMCGELFISFYHSVSWIITSGDWYSDSSLTFSAPTIFTLRSMIIYRFFCCCCCFVFVCCIIF